MPKKKERPDHRTQTTLQGGDQIECTPVISSVTMCALPKVTCRVIDESEFYYILRDEQGEEFARRKTDCELYSVSIIR